MGPLSLKALFLVLLPQLFSCQGDDSISKSFSYKYEDFYSPAMKVTKITIPGIVDPYNGSIIEYGNGYLLAFRFDKNKFKWQEKKSEDNQQAYIGLITLDEQYHPTSDATIYDPKSNSPGISQTEDPRLFKWNDKIFLLYNDSIDGTVFGPRKMHLAEITSPSGAKNLEFGPAIRLVYDQEIKTEKNWSPFIHNDQIYFIYSFQPLLVLERVKTTNSEWYFSKAWPLDNMHPRELQWKYGHLRGGTPAVSDPLDSDSYVTLFHASLPTPHGNFASKRDYFMGFMRFQFERNSLVPLASYKRPLFNELFYDSYDPVNGKHVVFPSGLIVKNDKIIISMGKNDNELVIFEMPRSELGI